MSTKNYYQILGITDEEKKLQGDAFAKVLKKKHRALSLKYHPDRNPGNNEAEEKFKEINEANEVLSDPQKRQQYDNPQQGGFGFNPMGGGFGGMDMEDILRQFTGGFGFGGRGNAQRTVKGGNLRIPLKVTLEEIYSGTQKTVKYTKYISCSHCHGTGKTDKTVVEVCPHCHGTGAIYTQQGAWQVQQTCGHCQGTGKIIKNPCPHCGGNGLEPQQSEITIPIRKGVVNGEVVTFTGLGNAPEKGQKGINGDLLVQIVEQPHPVYTRQGLDLHFNIKLPIVDAILGTEIEIETLAHTKLKVKIPQGIEDGNAIRVKGHGLTDSHNGQSGSIVGTVNLSLPKSLNQNELYLLNELKRQEHFR